MMMHVVLVIMALSIGHVTIASHCYAGMPCWPQKQDFIDFSNSLEGDSIFAGDSRYQDENAMWNTRTIRYPYVIVMAESDNDVIKSVKFANKFNIRITVKSSGHDYIGRATADGSLQINLKRMQGVWFDLNSDISPLGVVTAESGNSWVRLYKECHQHNRSIVGGAAKTVSMGGYTLGGGHSPIARMFGLAVDNLLAVTMVAANGSLVYANATTTTVNHGRHNVTYTNGDLFWALRGGGGSTYGIVTKFTIKLHNDSNVVSLSCSVPYVNNSNGSENRTGEEMSRHFTKLLTTSLAPEWGGYEVFSSGFTRSTMHGVVSSPSRVSLYLSHFGLYGSPSYNTITPFLSTYGNYCTVRNFSSMFNYASGSARTQPYKMYIFNVLMEKDSFTDEFYDYIFNLTHGHRDSDSSTGCTGTLIGGHMGTIAGVDDTAVHPTFRSGVMVLTCWLTWTSNEEARHLAAAERLAAGLLRFGHGTYFNEPGAYLPDWKAAYWGGHYSRLYHIKQLWDPDNVFSCYHCVGSDEKGGLTANPSTIIG